METGSYYKTGNIYKIIRITGRCDNILGISFDETNSTEANIEVIEWDFPKINKTGIRTPKEEVLKQVLRGLELINESLGTNYKLSKIYYVPYDISTDSVYSSLIGRLIEHYHAGKKFKEVV